MDIKIHYANFLLLLDDLTDELQCESCLASNNGEPCCNDFEVCCSEQIYKTLLDKNIISEIK